MRRLLLSLLFFLVACQFEEPPIPGRLATTTPEEIVSPDTAPELPTQTPTTIATHTLLPEPSMTPTPSPSPTIMPTMTPIPNVSSDLNQNSLTLATSDDSDSEKFDRISGWELGFRSPGYCQGAYRWLDSTHLLLYAITNKDVTDMGTYESSIPIIIDIETGKSWKPVFPSTLNCGTPLWSEAKQVVIVSGNGGFSLLNTDGELVEWLIGEGVPRLSPSGRKLFAYNTWYDLETGNNITLQSPSEGSYFGGMGGPPAWSQDEMQLFSCCFVFADVLTGEIEKITRFIESGRGSRPGKNDEVRFSYLLNDNLGIVDYDSYYLEQTNQQIIPLFDLQTRDFINIQEILGLGDKANCNYIQKETAQKFLQLRCDGQWYVLDPQTMKLDPRFQVAEESYNFSPNEQYAVIKSSDNHYLLWEDGQSGFYDIGILPSEFPNTSRPISQEYERWSPESNWFSFWTNEFKNLSFLNPVTKEIQAISFPEANGKVRRHFWTPIEDKVALFDADGHLWWVPEISNNRDAELVNPLNVQFKGALWEKDEQELLLYDENGRFWKFSLVDAQLDQLTTTPFESIHSVKLSPDGTQVTFVEGTDVVILSLDGKE
jgi:hypothetical protein